MSQMSQLSLGINDFYSKIINSKCTVFKYIKDLKLKNISRDLSPFSEVYLNRILNI